VVLQGGTAVVNVVANGAALASSISGAVTNATQRVGRSLQASGLAMTKFLTVPLAAVGAVSTKLALDFNTTFSRIEALAGDIGHTTEEAKGFVLDLAHATGQDPGGLAEAMYFAASAGLAAKDVFPVVRASAQAAATGMADAATNAKLLTTVLHDYAGTGLDATNAMNILTRAIKVGKAEPADFAENIGIVIPLASQLGVSFQDVAAAIAQATNAGVEASRATTGLRFLLAALQNPTEESKKKFEDFGISIQDVQSRIAEPGGLLAVMQDIAKTFDLTTVAGKEAWGTITGGARGAVIANTLVGNSAESARKLWEELGLSAKDTATDFQDAFDIMKKTPQFKFNQALTDLKETAIELGNILIPILVHDVVPAIKDAAKWFKNLDDSTKKTIVQVGLLVAALGPLLAIFGSILRVGGGVINIISKIGTASAGAAGSAGGAGSTATAIGTGFAEAAVGVGAFAVAAKQGFDQLQRFKDGDFEGFVNGVANAWEVWGGVMTGISQDVGRVGTSLKVSQESIEAWATQLARGTLTGRELTTALLATGASAEEVAAIIEQVKAAQEGANIATHAWLNDLVKSGDLSRGHARNLDAIVTGYGNLGIALSQTDRDMVSNLIKVGDFQGALKLLRTRLKEISDKKWHVEVTTKAETAALDALNTKMRGLGFHQTQGGEWQMNASVLVHTRPNSPWPWEVIEDGLRSIGFQKRAGGSSGGGEAFFMKTIIEVTSNFEHVKSRLETLIPLIRAAAGEGAADQARAFSRDLNKLEKQFDRLKTKATDFRDAIKGAFTDSADLIGTIGDELERFRQEQEDFLQAQAEGTLEPGQVAPEAVNIQALIQNQVNQASQLAKLLKQLQSEGLNVANLTDLAGQGAGAIPIAQALLNDPALIDQLNNAQESIARITQKTADQMTQAAFGEKLLKMSSALDTLLERLNHFLDGLHPEKINDKNREFVDALDHLINAINNATGQIGGGGGNGNNGRGGVTVNVFGAGGEETARAVREELLRIGRNNGGTGL